MFLSFQVVNLNLLLFNTICFSIFSTTLQVLMWVPSIQYIRVAYSCDKTVGSSD